MIKNLIGREFTFLQSVTLSDFNNNTKSQTIKTNRFKENIKNFKSGKDVFTEKTFDLSSEITLEPKSALILELK